MQIVAPADFCRGEQYYINMYICVFLASKYIYIFSYTFFLAGKVAFFYFIPFFLHTFFDQPSFFGKNFVVV